MKLNAEDNIEMASLMNNNNCEDIHEVLKIPEEESPEEELKNVSIMKAYKKHLIFSEKNISPFKLICHLSYQSEIILMIFAIIGAVGAGTSQPLIAYLVGQTIGDYSKVSDSYLVGLSFQEKQSVFNEFRDTRDTAVKNFLFIGIGIFVTTFISNFLWEYVGLQQVHHLKEKYFATILKQEQGWFDINNPYEFATKVQAQIEQIEFGLGEKIGQSIENLSTIVSGLIIAFLTSWELTLIMLTLAPLMGICLYCILFSLKKTIVLSRKAYEKAGGMAEEILYNIKTVASFSNYDHEIERFNKRVDYVYTLEKMKALRFGISVGCLIFVTFCSFAVAVLYSKNLIISKKTNSNTGEPFTGGDVMTVNFSVNMAIMAIDTLAPNINIIQESCQASSDYFTLVERKVQIDESRSYKKPSRDLIKGNIQFRHINFKYPSDKQKKLVLDDLNINIPAGKKVAFVGESGCGKSTTVNLIERLYEAESGDIFIDGINIKEFDIKYLRSLIGYVQQEPILFNKSIRDNIIFGRKDLIKNELNENEDELLYTACREAYAEEFINKKEEKYDYIVGVKGSKLSGGQKQRVAIARAILLKPKILILDEATSALDNQSEKEVQKSLDNVSAKNITTIIIAHRLSTIKNADIIFALKNGKVVEQGTHEELLKLDGYYAGLVKSQITQEEFANDEHLNVLKKKTKINAKINEKNISKPNKIDIKKTEDKTEKNKMRLFALFRNHKLLLSIATIGALCNGAIHPITALIRAKSVNSLSSADEDVVRDDGTFYGCFYFLIAFLSGLFMFLKVWSYQTIGSMISNVMRKKVIQKYLFLDMAFYDVPGHTPGALLARLSIDTTQMNQLVLLVAGDIVQTTGVVILGLIIGFLHDYRLTLIGLCFIPFSIYAQILVNKSRISGRATFRDMNIESGSILSECVINTKSIFAFNFQSTAVDLYIRTLDNAKKDYLSSSIFKGIVLGIGQFANFAGRATMFYCSAVWILNGTLKFEDMTTAIGVTVLMNKGCSDGLRGIGLYSKAKLAFNSVFKILDTKAKIDVTENTNKNKIKADNITGKIEFKNVSFAYPTKPDTMILKNINFTIESGQSAALVGYSGCGKSTVIQLLERFYDVTQGEILIDGVNIKQYDINSLRRKIGLVSQEPVLFKRSVYQNILYGNLNADEKEVKNSARRACIEKFFYQKEMGTKENPVSGGEKQRLAIARAFLKNPRILLLDEATSALDKESEKEVQKSIDSLMQQRTSVSVAHRLSTIENCDVIFVLEDGCVVEQGNHQELMGLGKKYAYLYRASQCS